MIRRLPWLNIIVVVAVPVGLLSTAWIGGRLLAPGDGYQHNIPWFAIVAGEIKAGRLPTWNPFSFSGSPLLANPQAPVFYPPSLLFLVLPLQVAANCFVLISYAVAGMGAWLLARHLSRDEVGAVIAGVMFPLSGFMVAHLGHHTIIASAAWLPWILYSFEILRNRISPGRLTFAGLTVAASALSGHQQIFFISMFALVCYGALSTLLDWHGQKRRSPAGFALMSLIGIGVASIHLMPITAVIDHSDRSAVTYDFAMAYSLSHSEAPLLMFPYLFGGAAEGPLYPTQYSGAWNLTELSGYPALAAAALAAAGLVAGRSDRRVLALAFCGTLALGLAFGASTVLGRIFFALPIFGQFRAWARFLLIVNLIFAVFSAYGVSVLRSKLPDKRARGAKMALLITGIVPIIALAVPHIPRVATRFPGGSLKLSSVLIPTAFGLLGSGLAVMLARNPARLPAAMLVPVVALDLIVSFAGFAQWRQGPPISQLRQDLSSSASRLWGKVLDAPNGIDRYLFMDSDPGPLGFDFVSVTDLKRVRSANGSSPLAPAYYMEALGMSSYGGLHAGLYVSRSQSDILDLLRISTVITNRESSGPALDGESLLKEGWSIGNQLVRYNYAPRLQDAFVVGAVESRPRKAVLAAVRGLTPFDPGDLALIEGSCRFCPSGPPGPAGKVHSTHWSSNRVTVRVSATRPGLLIVSQAWFPGWHASVDGKAAPVLRANGIVQGVPIGPGRHRVELRYRSPGLKAGAMISSATVMILILYWCFALLRPRRSGIGASGKGLPNKANSTPCNRTESLSQAPIDQAGESHSSDSPD